MQPARTPMTDGSPDLRLPPRSGEVVSFPSSAPSAVPASRRQAAPTGRTPKLTPFVQTDSSPSWVDRYVGDGSGLSGRHGVPRNHKRGLDWQ